MLRRLKTHAKIKGVLLNNRQPNKQVKRLNPVFMKSKKLLDEIEQKLAELEVIKHAAKELNKTIFDCDARNNWPDKQIVEFQIDGHNFAVTFDFVDAFYNLETALD